MGSDVLKILIVEDNPAVRGTLNEILCARFPGMCIAEAGGGDEALRIADELVPDLVFMDIRIPGESGLELTRKIKMDYPNTIVVILTSYDYPEYREAAQQCGASHFLCKGEVSGEEIGELVESILSHRDAVGPYLD